MGVTLDSIRQLNTMGDVSLQDVGSTKKLEGSTVAQKIGAFFHTSASKARNAEVVQTLKTLVQSEPRYVGIHEHAKGLIEGIKINKPIQGSQLREIVEYLDSISTDDEMKKMTMSCLLGSVNAARVGEGGEVKKDGTFGVPASLKNSSEHVKTLYNNKLSASFEAVIDHSKTTEIPHSRLHAINQLAENARLDLDQNLRYMTTMLNPLPLEDSVKDTFLQHILTSKTSKADNITTILRYAEIQGNKKIDASFKDDLYTAMLGDGETIPTYGSFRDMLHLYEEKTAREIPMR